MKIFGNKLFKIIFNIVKFIVLLFIILYIAFIFLQRISNNKSVGGYRVYTIATSSMKGVYNVNDVILVKDCNPKKLKVGDDIVYVGNKHDLKDKIISHRIIEIKKDDKTGELRYVTKGVANDISDPEITADQILGKVDRVLPIISVIVLEILHVASEIGEDKQKIDRIGQTTIAMERIMEEEKKEEEEEDEEPVIERVSDDEKKLDNNKEETEILEHEEEKEDNDEKFIMKEDEEV